MKRLFSVFSVSNSNPEPQLEKRPKSQSHRYVGLSLVRVAASLVMFLSLSTGCSYFFKNRPPFKRPVQANEVGLSCVATASADLKGYLKFGQPDPGPAVKCVVDSLRHFGDQTEGSQVDSWTAPELANFFDKFFRAKHPNSFPDSHVTSTATFVALLEIKSHFFGGSNERLSKEELQAMQNALLNSLTYMRRLAPHIAILTLSLDSSTDRLNTAGMDQQVEDAVLELRNFIKVISTELDSTWHVRPDRLAFEIDRLPLILTSLGIQTEDAAALLETIKASKAFFIGGREDKVEPADWGHILRAASELWIEIIRVHFEISKDDQVFNRHLSRVETLVSDGLNILANALSAQPDNSIPTVKFSRLITAVEDLNGLPYGMKSSSLVSLLPVVFSKLLYGNSKIGHEARGRMFDHGQLSELRRIASDWLLGQKDINQAVGETLPSSTIDANLVTSRLSTRMLNLQGGTDQQESRRILSELIEIFGSGTVYRSRPLPTLPGASALRVTSRLADSSLGLNDLMQANYLRVMLGAIFRGYAHDLAAAETTAGLTESEMQELYLDVRELGRDLNLIDPRVKTAGSRTFMEASVFTSSAANKTKPVSPPSAVRASTGSSIATSMSDPARISLHEAVEWFQLAFGASHLASAIYLDLKSECSIDSTDVSGNRRLDVDCFRRRFEKDLPRYLGNLPGFVKWCEAGGPSRSHEIEATLEQAARSRGYSEQPLDTLELRAMIPILTYAENLFATYARNSPDSLDRYEVWEAFPVIQPFISKVAGTTALSDRLARSVYSWLLVFGRPPAPGYIGSGKVLAWSYAQHLWSESTDRLGIIRIIASFNALGAQKRTAAAEAYFDLNQATVKQDWQNGKSTTVADVIDLFQCQETITQHMAEELAKEATRVIPDPPSKFDSRLIVTNLKALIASDQGLNQNCLLF